MSNILTLKREVIGDSSYVPHLELYDAQGRPVNVPPLYEDTLDKIQGIAGRLFKGFSAHAAGQTVKALTERGLTVEAGAEPVSLAEAGVDDDWDELMKLLIGAGAEAAVKPPIQRLLEKTSMDTVKGLEQIKQKLQNNMILEPHETQLLQAFERKFPMKISSTIKIEAFIQMWLNFHKKKLDEKGNIVDANV